MTSRYDNQSHIFWLTCAALLKKPMDEDLLDPVLEFSVLLHITVTRVIKLHHAPYETTNRYQKQLICIAHIKESFQDAMKETQPEWPPPPPTWL